MSAGSDRKDVSEREETVVSVPGQDRNGWLLSDRIRQFLF